MAKQQAAATATVYTKQAYEGFFQGFTSEAGTKYFRGGIHIPAADGSLSFAYLHNRGTGSKLRFTVEVEFEQFGVIEFETVKGWNARKPEATKGRCLQGILIDTNGEVRSSVTVFQNARKDGSGFVYGIMPHKASEPGDTTCDSFF